MNDRGVISDSAFDAATPGQRQPWYVPAIIFGGLEFAIPVMMVGSVLINGFGLLALITVIATAMAVQWVGNALQGYMGAATGRASVVMTRMSFGALQSRLFMGVVVGFFTLGWGAVQTEIAGDAANAFLRIDEHASPIAANLVTVAIGLSFAIPAIIGFSSMKWTDYVAFPAGMLLLVVGVWLSIQHNGLQGLLEYRPAGHIGLAEALSMILGLNVAQWLIASDYTRYSAPTWRDQFLIPLGIISVGTSLLIIGAIMAIGQGTTNFVDVMSNLEFPRWGYLVLILAVWTSMLVNAYSMGIALSNTFNIRSAKGRSVITLIGSVGAVLLAVIGVIQHFDDYLLVLGIFLPPIVGVMFADFYLMKNRLYDEAAIPKWRWEATLSVVLGVLVGYATQYLWPFGLPPVQSLIFSSLCFAALRWVLAMSPKAA